MEQLLTEKEVLRITGLRSRVTLWRKGRDPNDPFPRPYTDGVRLKRWKQSDIEAWIDNLQPAS